MNIKKTLKDRTSANNIFPNVKFDNIVDLAENLGNGLQLNGGKLDTNNINYMGNWVSNNEYHPNDVVKYVSYIETNDNRKLYTIAVYKSITKHNSTTTPNTDITNWVELYSENKYAKYQHDYRIWLKRDNTHIGMVCFSLISYCSVAVNSMSGLYSLVDDVRYSIILDARYFVDNVSGYINTYNTTDGGIINRIEIASADNIYIEMTNILISNTPSLSVNYEENSYDFDDVEFIGYVASEIDQQL